MRNRGIKQVYVLIEIDNENEIFFYKDLLKLGIDVYILPHTGKLSYPKNIQHIRAIIKKHKPDIVHTSLPLGDLAGQIAASFSGIKNRVCSANLIQNV